MKIGSPRPPACSFARPRRPGSRRSRASSSPRAIVALLVAASMLVVAYPVHGAFVPAGSLLAGDTFSGWDQPNVYSVLDATNLAQQSNSQIHRFYMAAGTSNGGTAPASPENPWTHLYLRIDTTMTLPGDNNNPNWNVQFNLGSEGPGKADHLLVMRTQAGSPNVQVRLEEYVQPYPNLGAFTTNSKSIRVSNLAADTQFKEGVVTRHGLWDGSRVGFEVAIPIEWLRQSSAVGIAADGSGSGWVVSSLFSSGGSFGAVAQTRDILQVADGDGFANAVMTQNTVTGSVTVEAARAASLAFLDVPQDAAAGSILSPLRVEIRDANDARVDTATHEVTIAFANDPTGNAQLTGTRTVRAVNGVATFSDLSIDTPGSPFTLKATASILTPAVSTAFEITEALVAQIAVSPHPVLGNGAMDEGARWGGWSADPGASDVSATNYLRIENTGTLDRASFVVHFSDPSFAGSADPSWLLPVYGNIRFACAQTLTNEPPQALNFVFEPASATGSIRCTFNDNSAGVGVAYVIYSIVSIPGVFMDQEYAAPFTVSVED